MPITGVVDKTERNVQKDLAHISDGATFYGTLHDVTGLWLRIDVGVVLLDNTGLTWYSDVNLVVLNYRPVNCHIVIEGKDLD